MYTLFGDDVAYVGSSRSWDRAVSNMFVPHNMNIVPAWRVLTWALTAWAGKLERLPDVLAIASYSILVAVMLLTGRLVVRETGRAHVGLASMILVGTTSLMLVPATWYSAGKALWAGFGISGDTLVCAVVPAKWSRAGSGVRDDLGRARGLVLDSRPSGRPGGGNLSLGRRPAPMSDSRGMAPCGISDRGDVELGHRLQPL